MAECRYRCIAGLLQALQQPLHPEEWGILFGLYFWKMKSNEDVFGKSSGDGAVFAFTASLSQFPNRGSHYRNSFGEDLKLFHANFVFQYS